jgi:hypothetical protein
MTLLEQVLLAVAFVLAVYAAARAAAHDGDRRRDVAALQTQIDWLIAGMERQGQVADYVLDVLVRGQK